MKRLAGVVVLSVALVLVGLYLMRLQVMSFMEPDRYDASEKIEKLPASDSQPLQQAVSPRSLLPVEAIMPAAEQQDAAQGAVDDTTVDGGHEQTPPQPGVSGVDCHKLVRQHDLKAARACYLARLDSDPQDANAILDLGVIDALEGNATEAYFRYQTFLQLAPEGARAAQVRLVVDRYEAALAGAQLPAEGDTVQSNPFRRAVELFKKAYVLKESHPDRALRLAREALVSTPVSAERLRSQIEALIEEIPTKLPAGEKSATPR